MKEWEEQGRKKNVRKKKIILVPIGKGKGSKKNGGGDHVSFK